jgi:fibronectin-binding autotransporter adhesin
MKQQANRLKSSRRATNHLRHRTLSRTQVLGTGAAILLSAVSLPVSPAFGGAILYWDGDGLDTVGGGPGTWGTDPTLLRWSTTENGSTYQAWVNETNDDAVFSIGSGTVTPGSPITVNSITFRGGSYTLGAAATPFNLNTGDPTGTLTLNAETGIIVVNAIYHPAITTIVKNGSALLSSGLSQPATGGFAGKWIVNGGILSLPGDLRLGSTPTALVPDQVTLNGGFLRSSTASGPTFNANRGIILGPLGGGFDGSAAASITWSGPITGNSGGSLTKRGATTNWVLTSNTSDYDGPTLIESGKLTAGAANALGSIVSGTEVKGTAELVFSGPTSIFTTNEPLTIAGNGSVLDRGAVVVEAGADITLGGTVTLSEDSALFVAGDSKVVFSNANSFTTFTDRNLTLQGGAVTTGGGGTISGSISLGTGGLIKEQAGTWTLAGANLYSGFTNVNAGTLLVSGSITGTTQVDVTGTLGGSGTITPAAGGNVRLVGGGKLAPGMSAGTLSLVLSNGGQLDINSGVFEPNSRALLFELAAPLASDKVVLTGGALSIGAGVLEFDDFSFSTLPGFDPNADYVLFDGTEPINGTFGANLSGTVAGFMAQIFLADGGRDLVLHVVPEPGAATAFLVGAATLLGLRRRRN